MERVLEHLLIGSLISSTDGDMTGEPKREWSILCPSGIVCGETTNFAAMDSMDAVIRSSTGGLGMRTPY
jgi:hypothetical protein